MIDIDDCSFDYSRQCQILEDRLRFRGGLEVVQTGRVAHNINRIIYSYILYVDDQVI